MTGMYTRQGKPFSRRVIPWFDAESRVFFVYKKIAVAAYFSVSHPGHAMRLMYAEFFDSGK